MDVLSVPRDDAEGSCPDCGAVEIKSYPVLSEGGWFLVEKCQACLASVSRTSWQRLGYVSRTGVGS
jgi:hypothetical protein